jgi:beta-glucosidase
VIEELLTKLDLPAKLALITGAGLWATAGAPQIGLRALHLSDGPVGVRGWVEDERNMSANLPSPTALAASWDEDLLSRVGAFLAAEAVAKDVDVVLGPTINLHRAPRGGRHFECYSEDPLLTGRLAAAYVGGIQRHGVGACPKHYVGNDSETERMTLDARIDARVLRELYLAPFEHVVRTARPWSVMAAYNGVNGAPMTENPLLGNPLRAEWGFDGVVISDWGAVYSTVASARAGTDLAMPGPEPLWGEPLAHAIASGAVPPEVVDEKVRHLLRLATRAGGVLGLEAAAPRPAANDAAVTAAFAREVAAAGMVLLRNTGRVLPLAADATVALIGPASRDPRTQGGGSATVFAPYAVTPEQGLRAALGDRLSQADGVHLRAGLRPVRQEELAEATLTWLDADGAVVETGPTVTATILRGMATVPAGSAAFELRARIRMAEAGTWRVGGFGAGGLDVSVDGGARATGTATVDLHDLHQVIFDPPQVSVAVPTEVKDEVAVAMRFSWTAGLPFFRAGLAIAEPRRGEDEEFASAVQAASSADVAVIMVGTTEAIESEGFDREHLRLPGRQDDLVAAVAAANSRTVVVVNSGAPVLMPWRDDVAAVMLTWFPGMEFGHALADVLTGAVEPGGRLPTTWPAGAVPVDDVAPAAGVLDYREGLHIGHRAYLRDGVAPAYWFGAGQGYTEWSHESFEVKGRAVRAVVRNSGSRPGKHVLQVYLARPDSAVERPARWLAGYAVVRADPGERAEVTIPIAERSLQHWTGTGWGTEPGGFLVQLGRSAGDIIAEAELTVAAALRLEADGRAGAESARDPLGRGEHGQSDPARLRALLR